MKQVLSICCIIFIQLVISCNSKGKLNNTSHSNADPLPSWNDGPVKQSIISYVKKITDSSVNDFIPATDRIATFDNDGTLWAERPYVQELFTFYMAEKMVAENPGLSKQQPFKAAVSHDKKYFSEGGDKVLFQLLEATHAGTSEDAFESSVNNFFAAAIHPLYKVPVKRLIYQPQLELLDYLRNNGFVIFICTGGTIEFVRSISRQFYGIPKYQVIGTTFRYKFSDTGNMIMREPALALFNDKEGKPVGIQTHIGQRPVFACGNEGGEGDIAMLKYSQGNKYPSYQLLINHDDSTREFFYREKTNASLDAANKNNWNVVSMKNDWKIVFIPK